MPCSRSSTHVQAAPGPLTRPRSFGLPGTFSLHGVPRGQALGVAPVLLLLADPRPCHRQQRPSRRQLATERRPSLPAAYRIRRHRARTSEQPCRTARTFCQAQDPAESRSFSTLLENICATYGFRIRRLICIPVHRLRPTRKQPLSTQRSARHSDRPPSNRGGGLADLRVPFPHHQVERVRQDPAEATGAHRRAMAPGEQLTLEETRIRRGSDAGLELNSTADVRDYCPKAQLNAASISEAPSVVRTSALLASRKTPTRRAGAA